MNKKKIMIILAALIAVLLLLCCILLFLPEGGDTQETLPPTDPTSNATDPSEGTGATQPSGETTEPSNGTATEPNAGTATEPNSGSNSGSADSTPQEVRDIATGALTSTEKKTLSKLTEDDCGTKYRNLRNFANWAYKQAYVDTSDYIDLTVAKMFLQVLVKNDDGKYVANEAKNNYTLMLVPGYYGGSKAATTRTFTADDFQVGDLFCATSANKCEHEKNIYTVALYLGNGKFLVVEDNCETCANKSYTDSKTFFSDEKTLKSLYSYYYVLRPERVAGAVTISHTAVELDLTSKTTEDLTAVYTYINSSGELATKSVTWSSSNEKVATVANGKVTAVGKGECVITAKYGSRSATCKVVVSDAVTVARDIYTQKLTAAEKAAIAALTELTGSQNLNAAAPEIYDAANIKSSMIFDQKMAAMIASKLLAKNSSGLYEQKTDMDKYTLMLVPGYYGGEKAAQSKLFTVADFEIGDLFIGYRKCAEHTDKNAYTTAVYQGNGKFLAVDDNCCVESSYTMTIGSVATDLHGEGNGWTFYCVLRPDRLSGVMTLNNNSLTLNIQADQLNPTADLTASLSKLVAEGDAFSVQASDVTQTATWSSSNESIATVVNGKVTAVGEGECVITANYGSEVVTCTVKVAKDAPVVRDIYTQKLTDAEKAAIASLTKLTGNQNLKLAAAEIYGAANINSSMIFDQNVAAMIASKLLGRNGGDLYTAKTTMDKYTLMLVPGYYGGEKTDQSKLFTTADLEIGDLFIGYRKCTEHTDKNIYTTAVYQGNGKFLATGCNCACAAAAPSYIMTVGDEPTDMHGDGNKWDFYCVLRPDRLSGVMTLNNSSLELNIQADLLNPTADLTASLSKLVAEGDAFSVQASDVTQTATWSSSNESVATVVNGKVTAVGEGECVITANYGSEEVTCTVKVTKDAPVIRDIYTQKLTDAEKAAIAALTELTKNQNLTTAAPEIYGAANINVEGFLDMKVFAMITSNLLEKNADGLYVPKTEVNQYTLMLVPGYYGGEKAAQSKLFTAADFEIGDLFIGYRKCTVHTDKNIYTTAVYQGNGKFLAVGTNCDCQVNGSSYTMTVGDEPADMHGDGNEWTLFCVLRPDRLSGTLMLDMDSLVMDIADPEQDPTGNLTAVYTKVTLQGEEIVVVTVDAAGVVWSSSDETVATVENGVVTGKKQGAAVITATLDGSTVTCNVAVNRRLTLGTLTQTEQDAIAGLTAEEWSGKVDLNEVTAWAYGKAFLSAAEIDKTVYTMRNELFAAGEGGLYIPASAVNQYTTMMVPGYYGGSLFANSMDVDAAQYMVGDLFCGMYTCECQNDVYVVAIYKGDGNFLQVISECDHHANSVSEMTAEELEAVTADMSCYYVLRPQRVAGALVLEQSTLKLASTGNNSAVLIGKFVSFDASGTLVTQNAEITLVSGDVNVVTVEGATVTSVGAGTATVTASYTVGETVYTAECVVTVVDAGITLDQYTLSLDRTYDAPTATGALVATPFGEIAGQTVVWSSSNEDVATVDQNGLVTAVGGGECTVTATVGNYTGTCTVTVTRDVRLMALTDTEKAAFAKLSNMTTDDVKLRDFVVFAYNQAGITIPTANSAVLPTSVKSMSQYLFINVAVTEGADTKRCTNDGVAIDFNAANNASFTTTNKKVLNNTSVLKDANGLIGELLADNWGGKYARYRADQTVAQVCTALQPGDVICAYREYDHNCTSSKKDDDVMAVYLGNGIFFVGENYGQASTPCTCPDPAPQIMTMEQLSEKISGWWLWYTLRLEQLASQS